MKVTEVSILLDEAFIAKVVVPSTSAPTEVGDVAFLLVGEPSMDDLSASNIHIEAVIVMSSPMVDCHSRLIGTIFGPPMD